MKVTRPKLTKREYVDVEVDEVSWDMNKGDWILIERAGSKDTCVLGKFAEVYTGDNSRRGDIGGIRLEIPIYRIRVQEISGIRWPVIIRHKDPYDADRNFRSIKKITVGPEAIAERLPQINEAYAAYAPFARDLK